MTKNSYEFPHRSPRRFVWWMECDRCQTVAGDPSWDQKTILLEDFAAKGWHIGKHYDTCQDCLLSGVAPDPESYFSVGGNT